MAYQTIFKRYEIKYMLTLEQKEKLLKVMESYMALDKYGRTIIRNIYFDTDSYRLIRRSMEKPIYKEKIRIRSYNKAEPNSIVFVELKKKYNHIVYKRRLNLNELEAMNWVSGGEHASKYNQIACEIDYFIKYYENLHPTIFLSYEREAFYDKNGGDFRITFDERILARHTDLSLESEIYGDSLLDKGKVLMEVKCSGGIPLWLVHFLSAERIFKTSFSKYGKAYQKIIFPTLKKK